MRIKRFTAPDMRTALRMVREEQGPDAVILSNRATADGIEVVSATDYDESLVSQALRAATPAVEPADPAVVVTLATPAPSVATTAPAPAAPVVTMRASDPVPARQTATAIAPSTEPAAARESLVSRARAIFRIGDGPAPDAGPTLAELIAAPLPPSAPADQPSHTHNANSRFDEMMAAFNPPSIVVSTQREAPEAAAVRAADPRIADAASLAGPDESRPHETRGHEAEPRTPGLHQAPPAPAAESDADYLISLATGAIVPIATFASDALAPGAAEPAPPAPRLLHAVSGDATDTDPAILAMRRELATMRQLMERQMEQLSLERLRGSPARAAAFEALLGLGCDTAIAQAVAADLDPRIAPADVQEPMLAGLMRTLTLARSEPIEEGGVIALVGPTGAGKTTTAAKLAARFAARHRARDVALVSIDRERTGAREQLHALGRRLGVTVCDADNSDALGRALEQLVDYPLVLVDTAGYGVRDRALLRQILWLRSASRLRSLLVLPANAHPHDLGEIVRRYRPAAPDGVVLTKLDEAGRLGAPLSVLAQNQLSLAYTCSGQHVPDDLEAADAGVLTDALRAQALERRAVEKLALEKTSGAAVNPLATEDRHAFA